MENTSVVSNVEVMKYDNMIRSHINEQILKYWAHGQTLSTREEASIGRLGMSMDDLMQIGREYVFNQLSWFKVHGKTGPGMASEATMMFNHLRNRFQDFSKRHCNQKRGGSIVSVSENREKLQEFVDAVGASPDMSLDTCETLLQTLLVDSSKNFRKFLSVGLYKDGKFLRERFFRASDVASVVKSRILSMNGVSFVSCSDSSDVLEEGLVEYNTPESEMIQFENILEDIVSDTNGSGEVPEAKEVESVSGKVRAKPRFNQKGTSFKILAVARERGLAKTQGQLAQVLGISGSALSNILHGESAGNQALHAKVQEVFGESLSELSKVVTTSK